MASRPTRAQRRREARRHAAGARARARIPRAQLIGATAVAVVAVLVLIWAGNGAVSLPASSAPVTAPATGTTAQPTEHIRGAAAAPVRIEEWADFQCPACGQFARTTVPALLSTYVARGEVSIAYRHFAFLGAESGWAAEAAECAAAEGKFYEYHDRLFASQAGENRGAFAKDRLKRIGAELGLGAAFGACVDSGRYAQFVRDETRTGEARGVRATPTLFVNGRKIEGAASFEQLRPIIDALLAAR